MHRLIPPLVLAALATAAAAQDVPFAGELEAAQRSRPLAFADPVYANPGIAVETGGGPLESVPGDDLVDALAAGLAPALPEGVSLIAAEGTATLVAVGERQPEPPAPDEPVDREQAAVLGLPLPPELETAPDPAPQRVERMIVHYPVAFEAIPVSKYADATAFVDAAGRVELLRTRNLPASLDTTTPVVTGEAAIAAAIADAGPWAVAARREGPALEVWVDPDGSGRLSWRVEFTDNGDEPRARRYWIAAAGAPEVVFWESMIHFQHAGRVTGTIWSGIGLDDAATEQQPMPYLDVNRSSGGTATTGEDGAYAFGAGAGTATLAGALSGPYVTVQNMAGPQMRRHENGAAGTEVELRFDATATEELAQTTAFYWTNRAHDLAAEILDPADLAALPVLVNRPGECNAFWNGSSLNFFAAGGGCPNMAYGSVVLHEYGHGIDASKGGIVDGGYSEGFGDALSILGTRDPCVGRDFSGPGTCLRDASELVLWPPAPDEQVHLQGRRYAGFVWELVQQLRQRYPDDTALAVARTLVLGAAKANPAGIPDAVHLSFVVDDDDDDLRNGTPHFAELAAAADSRTLPRPPDPLPPGPQTGFAWADDRTAASYAPAAAYAHNPSGQPIVAARLGVGQYTMTFRGLGGGQSAGGNVQVTGFGATANVCKVLWWSSTGADFVVTVRCFRPDGSPADERYTILVTWP